MTPLQTAFFNLSDGLSDKKAMKPLTAIANALPRTVYIGKKVHKVVIKDLTAKEAVNSMFPEIGNEPIISGDIETMRKSEVYYFANHKRRLRDAYKKGGKKEVLKYIKWVDTNNRAVNGAHETSKTMHVVSEVIKAKIEPFL